MARMGFFGSKLKHSSIELFAIKFDFPFVFYKEEDGSVDLLSLPSSLQIPCPWLMMNQFLELY